MVIGFLLKVILAGAVIAGLALLMAFTSHNDE